MQIHNDYCFTDMIAVQCNQENEPYRAVTVYIAKERPDDHHQSLI